MSSSAEQSAFNYIISLLPQLITIIATIGAGFKFLQKNNDKKIEEAKEDIMIELHAEKESVEKDIKSIYTGINNLDSQYKIITGYIKEGLERHERMLDRLGESKRD